VHFVNEVVLEKLIGENFSFISVDSIDETDTFENQDGRYSIDFLNSIKLAGMPMH
jgi:hypothetical protein